MLNKIKVSSYIVDKLKLIDKWKYVLYFSLFAKYITLPKFECKWKLLRFAARDGRGYSFLIILFINQLIQLHIYQTRILIVQLDTTIYFLNMHWTSVAAKGLLFLTVSL